MMKTIEGMFEQIYPTQLNHRGSYHLRSHNSEVQQVTKISEHILEPKGIELPGRHKCAFNGVLSPYYIQEKHICLKYHI